MRRTRFMNHPARIEDLSFEDYYESYGDDMQDNKAQRLQVKQWRKLKHQLS